MKKFILILIVLLTALTLGACSKEEVKGIESSYINESGELIIVYTNGEESNLGKVVGKDGVDGKDGADGLDGKDGVDGVDGKDGKDGATGSNGINGTNGQDGKDAFGIKSTYIDKEGNLIITYTNDFTVNLGNVVGQDGKDGEPGEEGQKGETGEKGDKGDTGKAGLGIKNIYVNANGYLVVQYTDGTARTITTAKVSTLFRTEELDKESILEEVQKSSPYWSFNSVTNEYCLYVDNYSFSKSIFDTLCSTNTLKCSDNYIVGTLKTKDGSIMITKVEMSYKYGSQAHYIGTVQTDDGTAGITFGSISSDRYRWENTNDQPLTITVKDVTSIWIYFTFID